MKYVSNGMTFNTASEARAYASKYHDETGVVLGIEAVGPKRFATAHQLPYGEWDNIMGHVKKLAASE